MFVTSRVLLSHNVMVGTDVCAVREEISAHIDMDRPILPQLKEELHDHIARKEKYGWLKDKTHLGSLIVSAGYLDDESRWRDLDLR